MHSFVPCAGKTACTEDGSHCRGCRRSHDEIARTRAAISALTALALEQGYDNIDAYADYIAVRIVKKVAHDRAATDDAS